MIKKIIQRALPLHVKYDLIGVSYKSIEDGGGCPCENCGRLITNVATVKNDTGHYNIGTDCLETLLVNNELLTHDSHVRWVLSDKPAIAKAKSLRSKMLKLRKTHGADLIVKLVELKNGDFGFSFDKKCERWGTSPLGWDYTFNPSYKDLTIAYVRDFLT